MRAILLSRLGRNTEARAELAQARQIMTSHFGPESPATGAVDSALGDVEMNAGRPQAAVVAFADALRKLRTGAGSGPEVTTVVVRYAQALRADHKSREATALLKEEAVRTGHPIVPHTPTLEHSLTVSAKGFREN